MRGNVRKTKCKMQISNAGTNGQFLSKQSGNTGGLTWAAANNYVHPNHSGEVTSTADGATVIADNIVDEANLKISNSPTNGQFLSAQSGNTGGLTWAAAGGGKLLQVVNTSQASSSGSTARTVISQAITLASASNKCLVSVTFTVLRNSGSTTAYGGFYITGGGLGATTSGMIFSAAPLYTLGVGARVGWAATKLDASPGSTTPTYGLYFGGSADFNFAHSQITVMEIG